MFSLGDDIQKFQKSTYTLKDQTMTIDERFLGGGVTIKDLIQQNNFIICQMRKIKSVFLNFCKLNEKVYKTITAHEINAGDLLHKMNSLSSTAERKLLEATNEMKQMKKDTVRETRENREILEELLTNLRAEIEKKVDEGSFAERVKALIEEHDNEDTSSKISSPGPSLGDELLSPRIRKKRAMSYEDLLIVKEEMMLQITNTNKRIEENGEKISNSENEINRLHKQSKNSQEKIQYCRQDIKSIQTNFERYQQENKQEVNKILQQLRQKLSEKVWTSKLAEFNQIFVQKPLASLTNDFKEKNSQFYLQIMKANKRIDGVLVEINVEKSEIKEINIKIDERKQEIEELNGKTHKMKEQYKKNHEENKKKIQHNHHEIKEREKHNTDIFLRKIHEINENMGKLAANLEDQVFKRIDNKLGSQMKEMKKDIFQLYESTKKLKASFKNQTEQVGHVQDVVSKKANFTDLLNFVDSKADKKDFKEIQQILSSPKNSRNEASEKESQGMKGRTKTISFKGTVNLLPEESNEKNIFIFKKHQHRSMSARRSDTKALSHKKF